ncbi:MULTISPECIES: DoxX family protein [Corynebacterium]|uniref:DoxX family protein n=1 Tax=Corynebacterium auriscanis TaxID=99807 RepID=A0A0A2DIY3_9CORY|nr:MULTISPECIES: DoxX family protein [Corynebacterium]KGM19138.1 hypothetical protein MA47_02980 [Corynebacterium auriscanis]OFT91634.1 hypothetical protein HMPREF3098_00515 [Corynebacterium sp. HMSC28B08]WJY72578.1 DoxX [Corynebacterium auriscanis]
MIRTLARPLLASAFAVDGAQMVKDSKKYSEEAAAISGQLRAVLPPNISMYIPRDAETNARILGGAKVLASAALATGKAPRLAATTLAAIQVPTTLHRHAFWSAQNSSDKESKKRGLLTDAALLGGLFITSADTAGKPGLAWRVQKAMPGKSEQEKMIANAQDQGKQFAATASDQAQNLFEKTKDVAGQVSEAVSEYVDEHSDDWKSTANDLKDNALNYRDQAVEFASDFSAKQSKEAKKAAKKAQKKAKKSAKKF